MNHAIYDGKVVKEGSSEYRNIIRLVCLYCETLPFFPTSIEELSRIFSEHGQEYSLKTVQERGFRLAMISGWNEDAGKEQSVFGFYSLPQEDGAGSGHYDFYPVDFEDTDTPETSGRYPSINLLRFMLSDSDTPERDILPGFEDWFDQFEKIEPAGTLCSSGRIPVFLPFSGWEYVEKDNAIFRQFSDEIGQDIRAHDLTVEQLWTSRLSFSANYKVYEVIIQDSGQQAGAAKLFRRSYFMAKWQESDDSDQYLKTKAINGLSNVIHEIWDESTVESPGFILKDDTVLDYLRFFCWATEGNEGPFGLPDTVFDLPLKSVPEEQKQSIKDLRFGSPIKETDNPDYYQCESLVQYGTDLFKAVFEIGRLKGDVKMLEDSALLANLPFQVELFKGPYLLVPTFIPTFIPTLESVFQHVKDPLRLVMDEFQNQFVDAPERFHRVNAEELMKMVSIPDQEGHLFYVNEQLIPDHLLHVTTANISELTIRNAIFEKQVDLRGIRGFHLSLRFINCAFNGGLVASEGVFHRSLIFENCVFYKLQPDATASTAIDLHLLRSEADLIFRSCRIFGQLCATNMELNGSLSIEGTIIAYRRSKYQILWQQLELLEKENIHEFFDSEPLDSPNEEDWEIIRLDHSTIKGCLNIRSIENTNTDRLYKELTELNQLLEDNYSESLNKGAAVKVVTFIDGAISSVGIDVSGASEFAGLATYGYAYFQNSRFGGDINFSSGYESVGFKTLNGVLYFFGCKIDADISLNTISVNGNLSLYGSSIERNVNVSFSEIKGNIFMNFIRVNGGIFAYRREPEHNHAKRILCIHSDIELMSAYVNVLRLEGVRVEGKIVLRAGKFGYIKISYGWGPNELASDDKTQNKSPLTLTHSTCAGLTLSSIEVQESVNLFGLKVEPKEEAALYEKYSCTINDVSIQGDLRFFIDDYYKYLEEEVTDDEGQVHLDLIKDKVDITTKEFNKNDEPTIRILTGMDASIIKGGLSLKACQINGNLDLRNLKIWDRFNEDSFSVIDLTNTRVGIDITISGFYIRPYREEESRELEERRYPVTTTCSKLMMPGVTANGSIDFTGLQTDEIDATGSVIKRIWKFIGFEKVFKREGEEKEVKKASVTDKVILVDTEGEELVISANIFDKNRQWNAADAVQRIEDGNTKGKKDKDSKKVVLERAKFNKLVICDPRPRFNLSNSEIGSWDFESKPDKDAEESNKEDKTDVEKYIDILDAMDPFDKSAYFNVEDMLINKGKRSDANKIRRSMYLRELKNIWQEKKKGAYVLILLSLLLFILWKQSDLIRLLDWKVIVAVLGIGVIFYFGRLIGNLIGGLHGYGTRLPLLLLYWLILVGWMATAIYDNPMQFELRRLYTALVHCTPFVNLGNNHDEIFVVGEHVTIRMKFWFYLASVLSYLLLAGAFIGISNWIKRQK